MPGGYIYTSDGFLPECLRPNDLVYRSTVAASNNGATLPFSFTQTALPTPGSGYILSVTNAGGIAIQAAGTFGNIIPPGPQNLMPTEITYLARPKVSICKNYIVDPGFTNTTQFTNPFAGFDGFRDSHVNDAFGTVAWAWTSNANIPDKTNGILNVFVATGAVTPEGTLSINEPIQLSDLPEGFLAWDTAVAINRFNPNNIVVSYGVINEAERLLPVPTTPIAFTYRAVSFDGGKTWPINGPTNIQPTGFQVPGVAGGFGDNRGVASDKFGNIWYATTNLFDNLGNKTNQPTFWISPDGNNYSVAYTAPAPAAGFSYDFPQFCFGYDNQNNYGLWFEADDIDNATGDLTQLVGFVPIIGPGQVGTPTPPVLLSSLVNTNGLSNVTAALDGRFWISGAPNLDDGPTEASSYISPGVVTFKSPGAIDQNYAGPWQTIIYNQANQQYGAGNTESQPVAGYINSVQTIIYDDARQALYNIIAAQFPDYSQNMRLYFIISRDNGQTWSSPIDIATTDFANRGFQSMALDPSTGNLLFGWYDGRNDATFQSVQYFGAVITAQELDALVAAIPLSNPVYTLGSAA